MSDFSFPLPRLAAEHDDESVADQFAGFGNIVVYPGRQKRFDVIDESRVPEFADQVLFELSAGNGDATVQQVPLEALDDLSVIELECCDRKPKIVKIASLFPLIESAQFCPEKFLNLIGADIDCA